jgi:hypothetical protein
MLFEPVADQVRVFVIVPDNRAFTLGATENQHGVSVLSSLP